MKLGLSVLVLGMMIASASAVTIQVIPSDGGPQYANSFNPYGLDAIAQIEADGTLQSGPRSGPTEARFSPNLTIEGLMTTVPQMYFYWGIFNPLAPYNLEYGSTKWTWIVVTAGPGETVSLADLSVTISSSPQGNILGKTVSFSATNTYAPLAPGYLADGTKITSGPASQQVKKLIVGVGFKSFAMTSPTSVQDAKTWWYAHSDFDATVVATAKGQTTTFVLDRAKPRLTGFVSSGRFMVRAEANGDPNTYAVQSSTDFQNWTMIESIRAGQTNNVSAILSGQSLFVRYASQPPIQMAAFDGQAQANVPAPMTQDNGDVVTTAGVLQ